MPEGPGKLLDLVFRLADGVFQVDDVLHRFRLGKQHLEPLHLGLLGFQAALRVVVPLADVLGVLVLAGDVADFPHGPQKAPEFLGGNPDGVAGAPAAVAMAVGGGVFQIAPQLVHQLQ